MTEIINLTKHVAPTITAALNGPFAGVAKQFMLDQLAKHLSTDQPLNQADLAELLNNTANLAVIQQSDNAFQQEMVKLNVDVFSLAKLSENSTSTPKRHHKRLSPQAVISVLFLFAYFTMLAAIFAVEASDTINMQKGENSLMGELQILFGALTAGVSQVLSYWFGGLLSNKSNPVK